MKAISIRHPNVESILSGRGTIEVRGSGTAYRGDVLLHASSVYGRAEREHAQRLRASGAGVAEPGPEDRGAIVGIVRLVDCRPPTPAERGAAISAGTRATARAWVFAEPRRMPPVRWRGRIYLFDVDESRLPWPVAISSNEWPGRAVSA